MSRARHVLLVEDEQVFARAVKKRLARHDFTVTIAGTVAAARGACREEVAPDIVLLDMRLPDGSGLDFLEEIKRGGQATSAPVVVMSAYGELEDAVSAMQLGAADYLKKPIDLDELLLKVDKVLHGAQIDRRLEYSAKREQHAAEKVQFLGDCAAIQAVRGQIARIATLSQEVEGPLPTVLVLGETGTGKDVLVRLLHERSARASRPFVHVDCAALPKDLIEAELFGHTKGAFTDARAERVGLIEAAEDGLLFLDEIGELPLGLQGKLLAVLERRTLRRLGSTRERPTDAWFVAATNRDIAALAGDGGFRSDLYYRLNVLSITLPPLRDRQQDSLLLAHHFAGLTTRRYGLPEVRFTEQARRALLDNPWQGNVRELRHVIERAVLLSAGGEIDVAGLALAPGAHPRDDASQTADAAPERSPASLREAEHEMICAALQRTSGNLAAAARELGITRMALRYRVDKYRINPSDYRRTTS